MKLGNEEPYHPVHFLIVEDDDICVMGIKRAMAKLNLANPTLVARDGVEALEIIDANLNPDTGLPPFIVTLDLNMPRMNGLEFLEVIRDNDTYQKMVVFVLTTSDAPADVSAAYKQNIAGYIVKDNIQQTLGEALSVLSDYANLVVLPRLSA